MAFCAPRQLCSFLPTVVPRLTQVLADPHPKVQQAAKKALAEIGSVVSLESIAHRWLATPSC